MDFHERRRLHPMPEGPSLVLLKEAARPLAEGRRITRASGNTTAIDTAALRGCRIVSVRTWGKHFLLELDSGCTVRVHFLLFGSWRIDDPKDTPARLSLGLEGGHAIDFYACSVQPVDGPLDDAYDWRADVMSDAWDAALARRRLRAHPDVLACDALLDQDVFAGVGNIIKNEVLFRIRVHPLSPVGALPAARLRELVAQAREYAFEFLEWKRQGVLKRHWLAHRQSECPRCHIPFEKHKLGRTARVAYYCERCQKRYGEK